MHGDGAMIDSEILSAIDEIILGRIVKRSKHSLRWEKRDISELFIQRLLHHGYRLQSVYDAQIPIGSRAPAFLQEYQWMHFGWVKWTKYSEHIHWKYFGSELKKPTGSPIILITSDDARKLYINDSLLEAHDIDSPPVYE